MSAFVTKEAAGACAAGCGWPIEAGELVVMVNDRLVHLECENPEREISAQLQVDKLKDPADDVDEVLDRAVDAVQGLVTTAVGGVTVDDRPIDNLRSEPISLAEAFPDVAAEVAAEAISVLVNAGWRPRPAPSSTPTVTREALATLIRQQTSEVPYRFGGVQTVWPSFEVLADAILAHLNGDDRG